MVQFGYGSDLSFMGLGSLLCSTTFSSLALSLSTCGEMHILKASLLASLFFGTEIVFVLVRTGC